ncbi:ATP-binding cassette sub-family C member 4-like isoform X5 [Ovis aries]|uniref:ATP-binding cassette sub-family C member 4-like isoform X5 n=1 Tax=Ovis aries TaxID=9940 RepID=UPI002952879E|nr:ATP-binding cassette sub-family C member 4-like isoform X5 [Ovis aries]
MPLLYPKVKPNPLQKANLCSRLFFWWLNPLFKIGHKRKLEANDMYSVLPEDRSQHLGEELQGYWDQEVLRAQQDAREPSLTKAIIKCYGKSYLVWGMLTFLEEGTRVVQPIFLGKMVSYVENYDPSDSAALHEAYGYAAGLSACVLVWAVLHHLYFYHMQRVGMRLRVAVCRMIYSKALRLSRSAMGKTSTGQVVNLLSNDVNQFDQVMMFLHYLWVGPLQVVAVTALLWMEIGMSCLAGMAVLIILLLLQSCFAMSFSSLRSKTTALTDKRIRTMSEVVTGIRTIKMNAWEKSFIDRITRLRRKEISKILRSSYLRGMNLASFFAVSKIMIFVTFVANELLDNLITGSQVFVVVMLFEALRFSSTLFFPMAVEKVSEAVVSIQRIKNFLLLDEISQCYPHLPSDGKMIVDVQVFTASWEKASETPTLQGLSFSVRPGELLAVVGPVGAGKSSLLCAVLGELPPSQGQVSVHGRIAYVSQQPWVFPGTVRSNILFGKKYEVDRYEKVIKACALEEDLWLLGAEAIIEIGDGGTPLSEGQKARISLARAVYQDADIYLLDDPLSAVDAGVSRHLFEQCVRQALKEKITILVTHQLQYLKDASQILMLKDGKMVERGTYSEFLKSRADIFSLFEKGNEQSEPSPVPGAPTVISESLVQSLQSPRPSLKDAAPEDQEIENIQVTLPLEDHLEGKVGFKTYKNYFTAGADWLVIIFLILVNIAAQVAYVLQDWWLAFWANLQSDLYSGALVKEDEAVVFVLNWYLGVYSGLTVSTVLFGITKSLLIFYILVNSSQTVHNKMLETILRAPVLFFHRNPIGRILNRFSKDIGHMDDLLPLTFQDFIQAFLLVVGVVGVMVAAVPWTAIPVIPLGIIFFFLRRYFLETSQDVKRLECTTRSPVFSHLASSLQGLWTIRAYKAEQKFQELFDAHQDLHSEAWFLLLTMSRWLAVYLDVICAIFVTLVAFGALILAETCELLVVARGVSLPDEGSNVGPLHWEFRVSAIGPPGKSLIMPLTPGQVGLVLSLTLTLMGMFQWCVRQSAEVENMMISVERGIEYTDLEKEAPWELGYCPPPLWPPNGRISFFSVNLRYNSDSPLVLRNLEAFIYPRGKYGIVGRTGAGKSSLIAALFRLSEPEGDIYIDGILTTSIGLHDLRKKMSVALQEPVLFTGTMRENLDPFNEHTDNELWNALEEGSSEICNIQMNLDYEHADLEVQLKESIESLPAKMNTELAESGLNLSVGQKQLVCLARALLKKNQILIMDKATSYVDPRTDELIQKIICERFAQCTVLTIAHRLSTVISCEWIMVLDLGTDKECHRPYNLLRDKKSLFYKMVQQLGKAEAAVLTKREK